MKRSGGRGDDRLVVVYSAASGLQSYKQRRAAVETASVLKSPLACAVVGVCGRAHKWDKQSKS
jgi:hypothetical protein